MAEDI